MSTEVKLNYKGLKVKHIEVIAKYQEKNLNDKVELVSQILEIDKSIIYRLDNLSFSTLYNIIVNDIEKVIKEEKEPHQRIKVLEEI